MKIKIAMKKIMLTLLACATLNTHAISYNHLGQGLVNGAIGSGLIALATYSAGETLLDGGHGYYELKQIYLSYLLELEALENSVIMSPAEKRFWAFNQVLSRVPKIFWREIIAGSFTLFTGILAYKQFGKSIHHINAGL